MKTITIITTKTNKLGKNFKEIGIIKDFPSLDRFYYSRYEDITLEEFKQNSEYIEWYQDIREVLTKSTTLDPGLRAIKFSKLDDSDKNPNAIEGRFMKNETWNEKVIAKLISSPDFPCRKNLVRGSNRIFRCKETHEDSSTNTIYILPAFERDTKKTINYYIVFFTDFAKEIAKEASELKVNIALHASDFNDCEKENLGYCIYQYKYEKEPENPVKEVNVFLFSHVDNEFCNFLKGFSPYTSDKLFDEKTYKLHNNIDKPITEGNDRGTIKEQIKDQIKAIDKDEKVKSGNPSGY